jgi:small-conductance mechanosensitive channel
MRSTCGSRLVNDFPHALLFHLQSVDSVYRELRTLSAGINNATAIDRVFEMILNICFYTALFFISLGILGIGVLTFAVTFSSTVLALSFIIGSACSSIFEGLMMILVRRPYGRCKKGLRKLYLF